MGLYLGGGLQTSEADTWKQFKRIAKHHERHWSCSSLCLRSSKLIPWSTLCRGFSSQH